MTEAPAYRKVRNSSEAGPLLFSDITVVKHGLLSSKRGLTDDEVAPLLKPTRKRVAETYEPFVQPEDRLLSSANLKRLCDGFRVCTGP